MSLRESFLVLLASSRFLLPLALLQVSSTLGAEAAGLRFSTPGDWQRVHSPSPLRVAQFTIPRARGDDEDGEVILFTFHDPQGGRLSDAVERWYSQFTQPDGRPSREVAAVTTRKVRDLDVKIVDLSGTYRAQMGPMERPSRPGYRLLGAVIDGRGGPWYWQAVGPSKTIEHAKKGFYATIDSLEVAR
jgi:hypothetical protein